MDVVKNARTEGPDLDRDPISLRSLLRAKPQEIIEAVENDVFALRDELAAVTSTLGAAQLRQLQSLSACEQARLWERDGARDAAQWVSAQLGVSNWKARRMLHAGRALTDLPATRAALSNGSLSLDKVLELARFASANTERKLIAWARRVTTATVRTRADEASRKELEEVREEHTSRSLSWWTTGDAFMFEGRLPTDQGAAMAEAVDRLARELPADPDADLTDPEATLDARRVDALVALATSSSKGKMREPLVVLHAPLDALAADEGNATMAGGPVLHPETARRIACDANLAVVLEDRKGNAVGIGRASPVVPRWLRRHVAKRGHHRCGFRGCERKTHLQPHHVRHWGRGGPTDEDNLVMLCPYHHWLVHEGGWSVSLHDGEPTFFRPSGRVYEPGIPEPDEPLEAPQRISRLAELGGYPFLVRAAQLVTAGTN